MKKRQFVLFTMVLAVVVGLLPVLSVAAQDVEIESVCLVSDIGSVTDGTFNQFAHEGAVRATDEFGLAYSYIESKEQSNIEYTTNIGRCVSDGNDVVVTVGFSMGEATLAAAIANPDVYFIGVDQGVGPDADGNPAPTNYAGYLFREDQAGFLAGALAAQMTAVGDYAAPEGEPEVIAGVYGVEIPPVIKYRNGYEQGAKLINPDIHVLGTYIPSFTDKVQGGATANQYIGEGADVIFGAGGQTGTGGIQEAAPKGTLVIGVDQDEFVTSFLNGDTPGAENVISSAVKRVDQAVYLAIKALYEGGADFPGGGNAVLGAANDGVGFAEPHLAADKIPAEVTARMNEILQGLKDGTIVTGVDPVSGELLPDLLTVAQNAGNLTTLLSAIDAAGYGDMMGAIPAGTGITVFAPSDDAFAALPDGALDALMADPTGQLAGVLGYHIVAGEHDASSLAGMTSLDSFVGAPITVTVKDDGIYLNDTVKIVTQDILFDHGVIHVIDGVLMPPTS